MYKCISCGETISLDEMREEEKHGRIHCTFCGFRVLMKERPNVTRKVQAI